MSEKRRRTRIHDMAVAYHEAGHASAAWYIKGPMAVGRISIEPDEDYAGEAVSKWLLKGADPELEMTARTRLFIEREIMGSMAGEIAQRKFNPRSVRHYHGRSDRQDAMALAVRITSHPRELDAFLAWLEVRVENFVEAYWRPIQDLAEALLQRRKMTGKELRQWFSDRPAFTPIPAKLEKYEIHVVNNTGALPGEYVINLYDVKLSVAISQGCAEARQRVRPGEGRKIIIMNRNAEVVHSEEL